MITSGLNLSKFTRLMSSGLIHLFWGIAGTSGSQCVYAELFATLTEFCLLQQTSGALRGQRDIQKIVKMSGIINEISRHFMGGSQENSVFKSAKQIRTLNTAQEAGDMQLAQPQGMKLM